MRQDPGFEVAGVEQLTFVASGGFSTVYRGFQPDFGRWVAVKVVHRVGDREAARRRFEREQLAMGRLSQHPHVVNLYGSGLLPNGEPYLLMDYLSNGSLAQQLETAGPLPAAEACRMGADIASALAASHQLGIVHGDLKPGNVLLGADRQAVLTDFGIAQLVDRTATQGHYLTPSFSSPEQRWQGQTLPASDVWSLGATLFVLITGREVPQPAPDAPHNPADDSAGLAARALRGLGVAAHLASVLEGCLQRDPFARPDARTVQQRLLAPAGIVHLGAPVPPDPYGETMARGSAPLASPASSHPTTVFPGLVGSPAGFLAAASPSPPGAAATTATGSPPPPTPVDPSAGKPSKRTVVAIAVLTALFLISGVVGATIAFRTRPSSPDAAIGGDNTVDTNNTVNKNDITNTATNLEDDSTTLPPGGGVASKSGTPGGPGAAPIAVTMAEGAGEQCVVEGVGSETGVLVVVGTTGPNNAEADKDCCPSSIVSRVGCSVADRRYGVFRSPDATVWRPASPLPGPGSGAQEFNGVIRSGGEFVAVGGSWVANPDDFAATVWSSSDGAHWQQRWAWEPAPNDGLRQAFVDVAGNGERLVAVGYSGGAGPSATGVIRGLIFVGSKDAKQWSEVALPAAAANANSVNRKLFAVAWTGDSFVAGGQEKDSVTQEWALRLWRSDAAGQNWKLIWSGGRGTKYNEMSALASNETVTVGVGLQAVEGSDDGVVVVSRDGGNSWSDVVVEMFRGAGDQRLFNLNVIDGWFVASGWTTGSGCAAGGLDCRRGGVWASRDGRSWQALTLQGRAPSIGVQAVGSVIEDGGRWLAVGHEDTGSSIDARMWELTKPTG